MRRLFDDLLSTEDQHKEAYALQAGGFTAFSKLKFSLFTENGG
jgi:hypothetical protein